MRWLDLIPLRLRSLVRKQRVEQEMDDELRFHLECQIAENLKAGMSADEARYAALRSFGGVEQVKEECRDAWGVRFIETLLQDIRFGLRMLAKNPGFTVVAVITLALGIGANTVMFTIAHAVLWKALPFPEADRLVMVVETNLKREWDYGPASWPNFLDWRAQNKVFEELAAFAWREEMNFSGGDDPRAIWGERVSANYFETLQVRPVLGRSFLAEEDTVGREHVVILTYEIWRSDMSSNPSVLGRKILLNGEPYAVVGVLPPGFHLEFEPDRDVFIPLSPPNAGFIRRNHRVLGTIGRLKRGVGLAVAQADMDTIARRLALEYAETNSNRGAKVWPLREMTIGYYRSTALFFLGAVTFVLLIACANVANLMLGKGLSRRTEFAVRVVLGASRLAILRQVLTESIMLALFGGLAGIWVALWGVHAFVALGSVPGIYIPRLHAIGPDIRALGFAVVVSLVTAILFGLVPALQISEINLNPALKEAGRGRTAAFASYRTQAIMVVAEIALSIVLLTGAGLFIGSLFRLKSVDPGFDPYNLLTMGTALKGPNYSDRSRVVLFYQQLLEQVQSIPGVESTAAANHLPPDGAGDNHFLIKASPRPAPGEEPWALNSVVTPTYFQAMKTPLLRGRYFTDQDKEGSPRVVIINEHVFRLFFPVKDPVGERILVLPGTGFGVVEPFEATIVGVVANKKEISLEEVLPFNVIYVPFAQSPEPSMSLVVRTVGKRDDVAQAIRQRVLALDKEQAALHITSMEERLYDSLAEKRFNMFIAVTFAGLAVILGAVGVYGVISHSVSQRTHEIGIRMALGATPSHALELVLKQSAGLVLAGIALGLGAAAGLGRILESVLYSVPHERIGLIYGVSTHDPLILASVSAFLFVVAMLATYIPARRATKVDPMVALRYE